MIHFLMSLAWLATVIIYIISIATQNMILKIYCLPILLVCCVYEIAVTILRGNNVFTFIAFVALGLFYGNELVNVICTQTYNNAKYSFVIEGSSKKTADIMYSPFVTKKYIKKNIKEHIEKFAQDENLIGKIISVEFPFLNRLPLEEQEEVRNIVKKAMNVDRINF
jgi:hypothetical protein